MLKRLGLGAILALALCALLALPAAAGARGADDSPAATTMGPPAGIVPARTGGAFGGITGPMRPFCALTVKLALLLLEG